MSAIDLIVPHRPGRPVPPDRIHIDIESLGNLSGVDRGVARVDALRLGRLPSGRQALLLAAGAGYAAGAAPGRF